MAESSSKSYLKTVSLCCSFWAVGMVYNIFGPTILELQCSLDLTYDEVIRIIPARASGYAIGSLLVGLLHKHLNPIFTITVTMATMGTCAIFIPWAKSLTAVLALTFMGTMGGGMIDNTSNVLMLYMWGKESQPYMQALHFCFGFGSLVAPLLASPFLSAGEAPIEGVASNVTNIGALCIKEDLRFYISYAIIGTFCLCVSAVFLYMTCFARQTEEHAEPTGKERRKR
ncbi:Major facilitator superfamily domain-containing protein 4A [Halotydeus destructor]|nr:Major facilitator superfamily domain-containing protein 4A [Halotydeus destructor]